MGKKNKSKAALNSSGDVAEGEQLMTRKDLDQPTETVRPPADVSNDPYDMPFYSKQSAFALLWLLVFSFGMFTLPFCAFYGTKHILTHYFDVEGFPNTCGSVLAAVLVVNVIIMLYALKGFQEAEDDEQEKKRQDGVPAVEAKEESKKAK